MSISILEITSIPNYQLLDSDVDTAKHVITTSIIDLLSFVSSVSTPEQVVIELVLQKGQEPNPRMFIVVRSSGHDEDALASQIVLTLTNSLKKLCYSVSELFDDEFTKVVKTLRSQLSGRIVALVKEEKLMTSNVSFSGYYYYTDLFESLDRNHTETSNYNSLFDHLMMCQNTMVSFQLIPTRLSQDEFYALSTLSGELTTTAHGLLINNQMVKEVTADLPRTTYSYYTERASQPLFIANIIVASEVDDISGTISMLKSSIQQSVSNPIGITTIELDNSNLLTYDFFKFPWTLYSQLSLNYRNPSIWNGTVYQPTNLLRLPFLFSVSEASIFFRVPIDDGIIRGIHSNKVANDNELIQEKVFYTTNIHFGNLINSSNLVIGAEPDNFTRHALIVGTPGSGKTTLAINLLLQFRNKGIPFLAIEPTKTEYRAMLDVIPDLQVFTPGNRKVIPFVINPFLPPKGIRLEQYIPSLMSAFKAAFSMESPLDVIFLRAIRQCYSLYGWKNGSTCEDADVQKFGLFEFVLVFKKIVSESSYKPDTKANIETGGTFRLLNLLDQNKYIYDSINSIPVEELLNKPTIIELNAVDDDEQKALIMSLLLINICLYTKNKGSNSGKLNNIFMIDEAHVLLDSNHNNSSSSKAQEAAVKSIQKMIAEIRSFGTGIIIADQVPSKVTSSVVADTDIKVAFRLVEQNERYIIANSTNMSEQQSEHLTRLKKGEAFVYHSDLESPKLIVTPDIRNEMNIRYQISDKEITEKMHFWNKHSELLVPFAECAMCPQCISCKRCNANIREKSEYYASHIVASIGSRIKDKDTLEKYMFKLHELVIRYEIKTDKKLSIKALCNCTKVHFIRDVLLLSNFSLNRSQIADLIRNTMIMEANSNE